MSTPTPDAYEDQPADTQTSPSSNASTAKRTRTVAIIKTHALEHRFDIEPRISEAGFEIVKERQMEFDVETDPDTMYELFGEDYVTFAEGPVWVYVLERRRAVEVWNTLMGNPDPEIARQETPNSIRALYGISREQNAVMGSTDEQAAEIQILSIFASSPPFPTAELPDVTSNPINGGSMRSVSSSVLEALRQNGMSENEYATSNPSTTGGNKNGKFKARPLPATLHKPDIVPRMSRAAALRAGIVLEAPKRAPPTKEQLAKTFANVPGHKRSETISVASTAPPAVAPRMTRAASLRLGQKPPERPVKARASTVGAAEGQPKATFDGVPGHKRRETIAVASTKPPSVAPRLNRSAALRQQKESAPPSSFMFRVPSGTGSQPPSRSASRTSMNNTSTVTRPVITRPASSASNTRTTSGPRPSVSRNTTTSTRTSTSITSKENKKEAEPAAVPPPKPKPRVSSIGAPTIAPRQNKSAMLRAAKMANAAASNGSKTNGPVKKTTSAARAVPA
ncbi:hypothetical protein K474DRAFT_1198308 [Panus rudis PR-1116 ss-1]|nr:hypothetical protein K474DRAFT_1198308 [Panus rudis PR-1116 ss-1]